MRGLSLDQEDSPLCRLRREIVSVIEGMSKANTEFQEQVRVTLESLKVRRAEAARSTTHGLDFQDVVGDSSSNKLSVWRPVRVQPMTLRERSHAAR